MVVVIDPSEIRLNALPSVTLEDRAELTEAPSIYFAIDSQDVVQYIGRSINPQKRWLNHHRQSDLEAMSGVRIAYLTVESDLLPAVEEALITYFEPSLNGQRTHYASGPVFNNGIQWRLRQLMAEINLSNNDLAEIAGIHRVTVSKLKNSDVVKQISGDVLNKLCNGLTVAYRQNDRDRVITPGDLMVFTPDQDFAQKRTSKGEPKNG